jgi:hypothetical protein
MKSKKTRFETTSARTFLVITDFSSSANRTMREFRMYVLLLS